MRTLLALLGVITLSTSVLYVSGNEFFLDMAELSAAIAAGHVHTQRVGLQGLSHADIKTLSTSLQQPDAIVKTLQVSASTLSKADVRLLADALVVRGTVESLTLGGCEIDAAGMAILAELAVGMPRLHALDVAGNAFGDRGLSAFLDVVKEAPHTLRLESLDIGHSGVGNDGFRELVKVLGFTDRHPLGRLRILTVRNTGITDAALQPLADVLRTDRGLEALRFGNDDQRYRTGLTNSIGDFGFVALVASLAENAASHMSTLDFSDCSVTSDGTSEFAKASALGKVRVSTLRLGGNSVCDIGAHEMALALSHHACELVQLSLGGSITSVGFAELGKGLASNHKLDELDVSGNEINATGVTEFGAALFPNEALSSLTLSQNPLGDEGVLAAINMLYKHQGGLFQDASLNKHIQSLFLDDVGMTPDVGAGYIRDALSADVGLALLSVSMNPLGDAGLEVITSGLAHNTILQIFIVEKAGVSDDGVSGFCRVLYDHATGLASSELGVPVSGLRYVAFGSNQVGDVAAEGIAQVMSQGHTWSHVDLSRTGVTDEGGQALLAAVKRNSVVRSVVLRETSVSPSIMAGIARAVFGRHQPDTLESARETGTEVGGSALRNLAMTAAFFGGVYVLFFRRPQR